MAYDAFISYSHAADGQLAPALQTALHRFAKPWYRRRALHLFRDETSLAVSPGLWPSIVAALEDSRYFLLLASPEAAASRWVLQEVGWWLAHRSPQTLLIALTDGRIVREEAAADFAWEQSDALPPNLRGVFVHNPLWVDLRFAHGTTQLSAQDARFQDAIADLAATLHGRAKEDLFGEEVRQHQRTRRLAVGVVVALVLLLLGTIVGAGIAMQQRAQAESARVEAETQEQVAVSRQLAAQAANQRTGGLDTRLLLSLEANRLNPGASEARGSLLDLLTEGADLDGFVPGLHQRVDAISFRPDGEVFATAGPDGVWVWDAATRQPVAGPLGSGRSVREPVVFSPDGTVLAASWQDGVVSLFDGTSFAPLGELTFERPARFVKLAFSPNGITLAAAGQEKYTRALSNDVLVLWDWEAGTVLRTLDSPYDQDVSALAFSPDGQTLASAGASSRVSIWNWHSGALTKSFVPISGAIPTLMFSPDGSRLAIGGVDRRIRLWDTTEWQPQETFVRPNDRLVDAPPMIRDFAFSPDGRVVVAASDDGMLYRWRLSSAQLAGEPLGGHGAPVLSVAFSPDGQQLVSGAANGTLAIRSVASQPRLARQLNAPGDGILDAALTVDGHLLAAVDENGTIHFLEVPSGEPVGESISSWQPLFPIWVLALSADGHLLASGDDSGIVALWDVRSRAPIYRKLAGHTNWISDLTFLHGDQILASSSEDGTVRFWDVTSGKPLGDAVTVSDETLLSLTASPDGRWLAVGLSAGVALIDMTTRQLSGDVLPGPAGGDVTMVAFSPDGATLAAGGSGGAVLFDVSTRQPIGALYLPQGGSAAAVAFSPDGSLLATGGSDGLLRLWDVATSRVIGQLPRAQEGSINTLFFSPDGHSLIAHDVPDYSGGDVMFMDLDTTTWTAQACLLAGRNLSQTEWTQYLGNEPFRQTCPQYPEPELARPTTPAPVHAVAATATAA